ncbi:MAG: acyl-CoA dehydrogenase [Spirochaetota bacterium]
MASNRFIDMRDIHFVLFEMFDIEKLGRFPAFAGLSRAECEESLKLAARISTDILYDANREADRAGVVYDPVTKEVRIPAGMRKALAAYYDAGFLRIADSHDEGGMGMPETIAFSCNEIFTAASLSFFTYPILGHGNATLLRNFGTDGQRSLYLDNILSGRWGGTMCLTEPGAGSDVGALRTRATRLPDGSFRISGQKTFISSGDGDIYENIIHFVLARIEGDPAGTKGISLFIVPKYPVRADGSFGPLNDVVCTGIEHKMGLHGSATCAMSFGENGGCVGHLLGKEREGMRMMFHMINEARLAVARQGLAVGSSAYLHALAYARERLQGSDPVDPSAKGQVPIIRHPDVRRMLLRMRSYVEGMRMLAYYTALQIDTARHAAGSEAAEAGSLVDFLIPICKAGCTDTGVLVTSEAVQVHGGYGFCSDYAVEQLYRDVRITPIWEGTNAIQSLDLVMRKMLLDPGQRMYGLWRERVMRTIDESRPRVDGCYVALVERAVAALDGAVAEMKARYESRDLMQVYADATVLQQAFFMASLAWMHLWGLAKVAEKRVANPESVITGAENDAENSFYHGRELASRYYLGAEFPVFFGKIESVLAGEKAVVESVPAFFSGA